MLALTPALSHRYPFSASHRPGVGTHAAVLQSRQRLECGDLSPLSSASASQFAADPPMPRAKAPTSWRTPNAAASAKPALSLLTCRVRNALNTYSHRGGEGRGEEALLRGWPLSPALSPLVARGARETSCSLLSIAFSGSVWEIKCITQFFRPSPGLLPTLPRSWCSPRTPGADRPRTSSASPFRGPGENTPARLHGGRWGRGNSHRGSLTQRSLGGRGNRSASIPGSPLPSTIAAARPAAAPT